MLIEGVVTFWLYFIFIIAKWESPVQWRAEIGIFHTRFSRVSKLRSALLLCNYRTLTFYFAFHIMSSLSLESQQSSCL